MNTAANTAVPWQIFTCTRGGHPVQVLQLPAPYLDPRSYVCGRCADPRRPAEIVPYNVIPY